MKTSKLAASNLGPALWPVLAMVLGLASAGPAHADPILGLYPTGVSNLGALLTSGKVDPHYILAASADKNYPGPNAVVADPTVSPLVNGPWVANSNLSMWISVQTLNSAATGKYTYRINFTLANVDPATATISGVWAADDDVTMSLNGKAVGTTAKGAYSKLSAFSIPAASPFVLGANTLDFIVDNSGGGPTGLRIESIAGLASCTLDAQCGAGNWCNNVTASPGSCQALVANGVKVPGGSCVAVANPIAGTVGARACATGACDVNDQTCGIALGDGTCAKNVQCRAGLCAVVGVNTGKCEACLVDADCAGTPNTPACSPTNKCVQCSMSKNTCVGVTPVCDFQSGVCGKCASDKDCGGGTPACQASGACGQCSPMNLSQCGGVTPACSVNGVCTACTSDMDCGGKTPACEPSGACGQCSMSNKSQCGGTTPVCSINGGNGGVCAACKSDMDCGGNTPACQPSGACGQCSMSNKTQCAGMTPVCAVKNGVCAPCGNDGDCGGKTPACEPSGACGQCSKGNRAQCGGNTPICNLVAGVCAPCGGDQDCGGNTPACEPSGACGQCSMANKSQCGGQSPACDLQKGVCAPCASDADCGGNSPACEPNGACGQCSMSNKALCGGLMPTCDLKRGVCAPCAGDQDCGGNTPACEPNGSCGQCSAQNKTQCSGVVPVCDTKSGLCAHCSRDADCGGLSPACEPSGACGQCSAQNTSACTMAMPVCDATRGQCVICTAPNGGLGGDARGCIASADGHACELDQQGLGFCGCATDGDCGAKDSGRICDGVAHKCQDGCSPAAARNHCPMGLFCTSTDASGKTTGVCTMNCVVDADCASTPAQPFCLVGGGGNMGTCVACRADQDCAGRNDGKLVCADDTHACVECTMAEHGACRSGGLGGACLMNDACGCLADTDCLAGASTCDQTAHHCAKAGGSDGGIVAGDGGNVGDGGNGNGDDGSIYGDGGLAFGLTGGGLGCAIAHGPNTGANTSNLALALLAIILIRARRRR